MTFLNGPRGEAFRYIIIGGFTTAVDYGTYYLMVKILSINVTLSNVTSTVLAVIFAYVTNKLYVFQSRKNSNAEAAAEFFRFIASRLLTMAVEIGGVWLLVSVLGHDSLLGKIEVIAVVIVLNYILSKFLVFRTKRTK